MAKKGNIFDSAVQAREQEQAKVTAAVTGAAVEKAAKAKISTATMNKMVHEEWVALEVIGRICRVLDCTHNDVVSFEEVEL